MKGNACGPAGQGPTNHVFDLNNLVWDAIASDGASCSGEFYLNFVSVDCGVAGLVSGGIKVRPSYSPFFFCHVPFSSSRIQQRADSLRLEFNLINVIHGVRLLSSQMLVELVQSKPSQSQRLSPPPLFKTDFFC